MIDAAKSSWVQKEPPFGTAKEPPFGRLLVVYHAMFTFRFMLISQVRTVPAGWTDLPVTALMFLPAVRYCC